MDILDFAVSPVQCENPDKSDPLHGKSVQDIPEILTNNLLKISLFERHQLTEKFVKFMSENVKQKVRLQIKLNEIEAANAISKLLLDNQFDTIFLSKAKRRFLLFEISLRIIGKIDRETLSKVGAKTYRGVLNMSATLVHILHKYECNTRIHTNTYMSATGFQS